LYIAGQSGCIQDKKALLCFRKIAGSPAGKTLKQFSGSGNKPPF
jgi:hypothetical protein